VKICLISLLQKVEQNARNSSNIRGLLIEPCLYFVMMSLLSTRLQLFEASRTSSMEADAFFSMRLRDEIKAFAPLYSYGPFYVIPC
ncbi:hypothetical protein L9F63_024876, partial [Diploptera punctata]